MLKYLYKIMTKPIKITEIIKEANDTFTYKFNIPKGTHWKAGANGHFIVTNAQGDFQLNKKYVRHLSIMSQPEEGFLGFTTRIKEDLSLFKTSLKKFKVGDEIRFFGIKNHIPLQRNNSHIVLISMGVGIATFRPMILDYIDNQKGVLSITNINIDNSSQFVYQKELSAVDIDTYQNKFVSSREQLYDAIQANFDKKNVSYYVVGSDQFLKDTGSFLIENDVLQDHIYLDKHDFQKKEFLNLSA